MKRFLKILKWTGIVLLTLIVTIAAITAVRQNAKYDAPYPNVKASKDTAMIARGRHLIFSMAHCSDCHSTANTDSLINLGIDPPLIGGRKFELPFGAIYTKNITPDKETGIGNVTDAEIARALRYGVRADGTVVFDFMPFHNVSDEDMTAIISYLRAQKPVRNEVPKNDLNTMGKVVKAFMVKPVGPSEDILPSVKKDTSAAYGRYIAMNVANCNGCHTKRDMTGGYIGEPFAGGEAFEEPGLPTLTPPNLTPDSSSRIFGWSKDNFIARVRMGKIIPHSHMPWNSYKRMTDEELTAVYNFLRSLKPVRTVPDHPAAAEREQQASLK